MPLTPLARRAILALVSSLLVSAPAPAQTVAAGWGHAIVAMPDGTVWTWGANTNGQLGNGTTTRSTVPIALASPTGVAAVGAGSNHTLAVKSDGTQSQRTQPVQMTGVTSAAAAAGGQYHSQLRLQAGTLRATGFNNSGQLGDATTTMRTSSVPVGVVSGASALEAGVAVIWP